MVNTRELSEVSIQVSLLYISLIHGLYIPYVRFKNSRLVSFLLFFYYLSFSYFSSNLSFYFFFFELDEKEMISHMTIITVTVMMSCDTREG